MRGLPLLFLVTVVGFLAHAAGAARKLAEDHRRGLAPGSRARFSSFLGMIVMPVASPGAAAVGDPFAAPWGYRVVAPFHLVWGVYLFGCIARTILRLRTLDGRA